MNLPHDRSGISAPAAGPGYPHLVVRIYSAVYQRERVRVLTGPEPCARIGFRSSFVRHPQPLLPDGSIGPDCRELLVHAVQAAVRRTGFRMCLVWSADRCTFVEKDEFRDSDEPPSGGFDLPFRIQFDTRLSKQARTALQEYGENLGAAAVAGLNKLRTAAEPPKEKKDEPDN